MTPWIGGALAFCGVQLFLRAAQGRPSDPYVRPQGAPVRILLFVPVDEQSAKIDAASGGHGYSHVAVDAGEMRTEDLAPLVIDCVPFKGVHRRPLTDYGDRDRTEVELPREVGEHAYGFIRGQVGRPFDTLGFFGSDSQSTFCRESLPQRYRGHVLASREPGKMGWYASVNAIPSPNQLALAFGVERTR